MTATEQAKELLELLSMEDDEEERIKIVTITIYRIMAQVCQICSTGYGNGRGKPKVLCALCRKEPEIIVCYDCARKSQNPSWGS